jgi:hypothetical protein
MAAVTEVITQIGQTGVIVAGASWLAKSIFSNWLSKNVESHKSELNKSVEQYKSEIQRELQLHQIRNNKLHNDRTEVIRVMYKNLILMEHWLHQTFWPAKYIGGLSLEERAWKADDAVGVFGIYYSENKIYFSKDTCNLFDKLMECSLKIVLDMRQSLADKTNEGGIRQKEVWHDSWNAIDSIIPSLKSQLENDFRQLLGVI